MNTIVVPTDCSELSRRALKYADAIAVRTGAKIVAVYGERFSGRLEGEGIAASIACRDDLEWMEMPVRQQINVLLTEALSPETQRKVVIADEDPAEAIVEVAERQNADLVIIGAHDRNAIMRAVLGSVTDVVLRESNRPVIIIREHNDASHEESIRTVLCPFRESPASRVAVLNAVTLADAFQAKLVLVQMVQSERVPEPLPAWVPAHHHQSVRTLAIADDAGNALIRAATETKADLIVLGTSNRRFSEQSPNAAAAYVVRSARCPVLAVTG
jgi:nucleotide-binding universal stress UspA family protein